MNPENAPEDLFARLVEESFLWMLDDALIPAVRRLRLHSATRDPEAARPTVTVLLEDSSKPGQMVGTRCSVEALDDDPANDKNEDLLALAATICATNLEEAFAPGARDRPQLEPGAQITWV